MELYEELNPCVDIYTRVDTETLGIQIDTLKYKFSKIHRMNWSFFIVTWIPIALPFLTFVVLILLNDGQYLERRVSRRDVINSRALDQQIQANIRRQSEISENSLSRLHSEENETGNLMNSRSSAKKKKSKKRRSSQGQTSLNEPGIDTENSQSNQESDRLLNTSDPFTD